MLKISRTGKIVSLFIASFVAAKAFAYLVAVICGIFILGSGTVIVIELMKWCKKIPALDQPVKTNAPCPPTFTNRPATNHVPRRAFMVVTASEDCVSVDNISGVFTNVDPDGFAFHTLLTIQPALGGEQPDQLSSITITSWWSDRWIFAVSYRSGVAVSTSAAPRSVSLAPVLNLTWQREDAPAGFLKPAN